MPVVQDEISLVKVSDGNDGKDGVAGKDGVGISNTKIEYVGSSSGTVKPTSGWSTTIPAVPEGSFLWTKTTWSYTDNTSEVGYSVAKMGAKGDQGNQGIPGTPGADGKTPYTHWAYAWSVDGTDRFTTTYPGENLLLESGLAVKNSNYNINQYKMTDLMEEGKIYTIRLKGVLGTGKSHFGAWLDGGSISLGSFVNKGNGLYELTFTGKKGTNTTTSIIYIYTVYSSVVIESSIEWIKLEEGKSATIWTPSPTENFEGAYPTFAGTYTDYEPTDSEDPSKYTWQRILGESGQDGNDGKDGANGQDAKEVISGYLSNESIIVPATAAGSVTDFSKAVGDFVVYEGQTKLSSGVTYSKVSETGMTSTINSAGRYTVTALSADVGTATYQAVYKSVTVQKIMIVVKNKQGATGPAGSNGTDGKGIVSSATTYQAGTSGTTPPNGTWSSSIPSVSENQYLWTRVVLTYSDNTTSTAYSVGKMGAKGETGATGSTGAPGATGNGIKSTTINFASSTSGTVVPSSGWITSIPTVAAGNFLWTRTILTFTDNSTNTSYTVAKQGEKGDPTGIISQSTVPTNPYVGMLWQNTGASGYIIGATYQWNGSKFNLYIFTADNIVTTTLSAISANLGNITAGNISGVLISGSEFQNPFSNEPIDGGDGSTGSTASGIATLKGKLSFDGEIDTSHKFATEYGPVRLGGTVRLKTASPTTDPALMWWLNPYGLTLRVNGVGGTLRYQDLLAYTDTLLSPNSGFSQYTTSGDNAPIVSRVGRIVQLSGAFKNNNELPINADMVMGVLPEWARPSRLVIQRQQASYNNTFLLTIKTDGTINMSRHAAGASNVTVPSGSWLNIAAMFSAKDF